MAIDQADIYVERDLEDSLSVLAQAVHLLPYSALVGVPGLGAPERGDYEPAEYVSRLADWMSEYQPIIRAMVDDLQAQVRERISLQFEKDVVRKYLSGAV